MEQSLTNEELPLATGTEAGPAPESAPAELLVRPGTLQYLWYAVGGTLPPRHNAWVLHDVTCRTWWLRHFGRVFLILGPLMVADFALLPASAAARFTSIAVFLGLILFSIIFMLIDTDRRAVRAGYPFSLAADTRARRAVETQRLANHQRRERSYARKARRK
jgi:Family of unknown function (DUF5313)